MSSDALAATVIELKKSLDRLSSITESNGNKAEVAMDVVAVLCDVLKEFTAELREIRLSIPTGKGEEDGAHEQSG